MPIERRRRRALWILAPLNPRVREKVCKPPSLMRAVCNPGTLACPRSLMI
jgi:hypothetical protein